MLLVAIDQAVRSDAICCEWLHFITSVAWLHDDVTRASESKNDSIRDPKNRKDKTQWRIRFLETSLSKAIEKINELGKEFFDPHYQYEDKQPRHVRHRHTDEDGKFSHYTHSSSFKVSWTIIGAVVGVSLPITAVDTAENMARAAGCNCEAGDCIVTVRKLEPISPGASTFAETDKEADFAGSDYRGALAVAGLAPDGAGGGEQQSPVVYVDSDGEEIGTEAEEDEGSEASKQGGDFMEVKRSTATAPRRFRLSAEAKARILVMVPVW